jgi:NAD+ synthetase
MCQTNTIPGDFRGNVDQIKQGILKGYDNNVDIIVFPELTIPGYLCRDMIYEVGFVEKNLKALQEIVAFNDICQMEKGGNPVIIVGYIDANRTGTGKPFRNMAAVIQDGCVIATYAKHLLPFYDVFDEGRYYEPGNQLAIIDIKGERWGIIICEDGWNDKGSDDYNYNVRPLVKYRDAGVTKIISINSSPFVVGKPVKRYNLFRDSGFETIIYLNQLGGQDELVFDGNSFITHNGMMVACAKQEPFHLVKDFEPMVYEKAPLEEMYDALKIGLYDYVTKNGFKEVVLGSSGGIDSAVVIALACEVLGPTNVHGIRMPSKWSSTGSVNDALQLHQNLGCNDHYFPIEHDAFLDRLLTELKCNNIYNPVASENIQARIRGNTVMHFSNAYGGLALTTGNKTELALGYTTIFGDMAGGFAPICDVYKMQVYAIARYINRSGTIIPQAIIDKAPSAELAPGQTDEASLLPYPILDIIVKAYIEDYIGDFKTFSSRYKQVDVINNWLESPDAQKQYDRMIKIIKSQEFKRRQAPIGTKISKVAFGMGRRLPIVKR